MRRTANPKWIAPVILTGLALFGLLNTLGIATAEQSASKPKPPQAPFQLSVTETRYLPPAMYGQWSVKATLLETSMPNMFPPVIHDIWILERVGNEVLITNPANGASAAINVDNVDGDTATFHRVVSDGGKRVFYETPTLTVNEDALNGITMNRYEVVKYGRVLKAYTAKYRLEAQRISGARTRFGADLPTEEMEFEIEDIKPAKTN